MKIHTIIIDDEECVSGIIFRERSGLGTNAFTTLVKLGKIKYKIRGVHKYYPTSQLAQFGGK